jgi:hypothetical protein
MDPPMGVDHITLNHASGFFTPPPPKLSGTEQITLGVVLDGGLLQ